MKELELIHQNLSKYLKPDDPEIEKSSEGVKILVSMESKSF